MTLFDGDTPNQVKSDSLVLLRIPNMDHEKAAALYAAVCVDPLKKFVHIKSTLFDNRGRATVDLALNQYNSQIHPDGYVTLEMLGELFKVMGIFQLPPSASQK